MKRNTTIMSCLAASLALAALTVTSPAVSQPHGGHGAAIEACTAFNAYQPANVVTAIDNGEGYSLVWLTDADGELWMCDADTDGHIYAYEYAEEDLLEGAGAEIMQTWPVSNEHMSDQDIAGRICVESVWVEPGYLVSSGPDGLPEDYMPGYTVILHDGAGDTYLCNASGSGEIWAWAPLGDPINAELVS